MRIADDLYRLMGAVLLLFGFFGVAVHAASAVSAAGASLELASGSPGLATYSIAISGGSGPFNVTLYDQAGQSVGTGTVSGPGGSVLISFIAPAGATAYQAVAYDLGAATPYSFSSAQVGSSTPASNSDALVGLIAFVLAIVIAVAYYFSYNAQKGT
jgi:hypothetical protein